MSANGKPPILLVDDEMEILESLRSLLHLDFDVHTAASGTEAIDVLSEVDVHVVMTDQRMPDMTGVELLAYVREQCPEAVRLVFTGYSDIKAVIEAINLGGVSRYVTKPWDPDELMVVLQQACREYDDVAAAAQLREDVRSVVADCVKALDGVGSAEGVAREARRLLEQLDATR